MKPIYVHVGYPKAASSTLQKHLFQKHPDINYSGLYPTKFIVKAPTEVDHSAHFLVSEELRAFYSGIINQSPSEYSEAQSAALFQASVAQHLSSSQANVLSHEGFLASYFSHGDVHEKMRRLKHIVPGAKIIVVLRNQVNLIVSQYRDWPFDPRNVRKGKPVSLEKWIELSLQHDEQIGFMSALQYAKVLDEYAALFGRENVHPLLMEELAQQPKDFAQKISAILAIDVAKAEELLSAKHENQGVPERLNTLRSWRRRLPVLRKVGKLIGPRIKKQIMNYAMQGGSGKTKLSEKTLGRLSQIFAPSNRRLTEQWGLAVEKYGYPFSDRSR